MAFLAAFLALAPATIGGPRPVAAAAQDGVIFNSVEHTGFEWTKAAMDAAAPYEGGKAQPVPNEESRQSTRWSGDDEKILSESYQGGGSAAEGPNKFRASTVGRLFYTIDSEARWCSASTVTTKTGNAVLTAAHCLYEKGSWARNIIFKPGLSDNETPYGQFAGAHSAVDHRFIETAHEDYDQGFVLMNSLDDGRQISQVVGSNGLAAYGKSEQPSVTISGYPATWAGKESHKVQTCDGPTQFGGFNVAFMENCHMTSGASGGPWWVAGRVMAVTGFAGGGSTSASVNGDAVERLFNRVNEHPAIDPVLPSGWNTVRSVADRRFTIDAAGDAVLLWSAHEGQNQRLLVERGGNGFMSLTFGIGGNLAVSSERVIRSTSLADRSKRYWELVPTSAPWTYVLRAVNTTTYLTASSGITNGTPLALTANRGDATVFTFTPVGGPLGCSTCAIRAANDQSYVVDARLDGIDLGAKVTLVKDVNRFNQRWIPKWDSERGAYILSMRGTDEFKEKYRHYLAWESNDTAKGKETVVVWNGKHDDQYWVPRATKDGHWVLTNYKDTSKALQYVGQPSEMEQLRVRPYRGDPSQHWTITSG